MKVSKNHLPAKVNEIGQKHNASSAQMSLDWIISKYDFIIPISGSRKPERLKSNFKAENMDLSQEKVTQIDEILDHIEFEVFGGH